MRPREEVEKLIKERNLKGLLLKAGVLHGHFCPMLSLGVIAGAYAMRKLNEESSGMEEIIAIVETNRCFSDGIQFTTGCTFGNNALIYRDFGKTAVAVMQRGGNGLRISVKPEALSNMTEDPDTRDLFQKVVTQREGSREETAELMKRFENVAFSLLERDFKDLFTAERIRASVPEYAPMHESIICEKCGESVIATRIVEKDGRKLCISCAKGHYMELNGSGIVGRAGREL
jgi:formylmethanofuran dehydrogenase subunit E